MNFTKLVVEALPFRQTIIGDQNDNSNKPSYPLVSLALRGDLEIGGSDRRNDWSPRGDDPWHRTDDRRGHRQLDDRRRHRRNSTWDHWAVVVPKRDILNV